jgi:peroxiredoxin
MTQKMRMIFIPVIALMFAGLNANAQINGQLTAQTIPHFQFSRLDHTSFTDHDFPPGKAIFIMFFDSDCDHCQHAIKNIGDNLPAFKKIPIYLVSIDDENKINQFMKTYGSKLQGQKNVTILQDKLQQFITKFNPRRYPSMFIYSSEKKLIDYEDNPESVFRLVNTINKYSK